MKPHPIKRRRALVTILAPLAVLGTLLATDADHGRSTGFWVLALSVVALVYLAAFMLDKGTFDYPEADRLTLFRVAGESPTGAGLALLARTLYFVGVFLGIVLLVTATSRTAGAQDVRQYVPVACLKNLQLLEPAQRASWPDHPDPAMLAALAEHESCITLKHPRCCNTAARLKTAREEGAGIGQITRAWRKDGALRFDALAELRAGHPELAGLSWANVYERADLQNVAMVLKSRDNFRFFARLRVASVEALRFGDAGYNQGNGRVQLDRRACAITPGCDPAQWFGNVERTCTASHEALYGTRSPCAISRHHVEDVALVRTPKYRGLL